MPRSQLSLKFDPWHRKGSAAGKKKKKKNNSILLVGQGRCNCRMTFHNSAKLAKPRRT